MNRSAIREYCARLIGRCVMLLSVNPKYRKLVRLLISDAILVNSVFPNSKYFKLVPFMEAPAGQD